jgi:hypothetical protein
MDIDMQSFSAAPKEKWFERFFRFGLISKGVVYCLIGFLAVMAAVGLSRKEAGKAQALSTIYEQPFGQVLLGVIALGLFGYVLLRFAQAFRDIDNKGDDTKGIFSRIGYGISGLIYLALAGYAAKLVIDGQQGGSNSREFIVAKALTHEWGPSVVGIVGLIIIGSGIYQIYRGVSGRFMKKIQLIRMDIEKAVKRAGVFGYIARGIVLMIIGYLIFHAAITSNPSEAKGTEGAFVFIENKFGTLLMAVTAIGLIGYGIFMFVKAKYQRIQL